MELPFPGKGEGIPEDHEALLLRGAEKPRLGLAPVEAGEVAPPGLALQVEVGVAARQALQGRARDVGHPVGAVQGEGRLQHAFPTQAHHQAGEGPGLTDFGPQGLEGPAVPLKKRPVLPGLGDPRRFPDENPLGLGVLPPRRPQELVQPEAPVGLLALGEADALKRGSAAHGYSSMRAWAKRLNHSAAARTSRVRRRYWRSSASRAASASSRRSR